MGLTRIPVKRSGKRITTDVSMDEADDMIELVSLPDGQIVQREFRNYNPVTRKFTYEYKPFPMIKPKRNVGVRSFPYQNALITKGLNVSPSNKLWYVEVGENFLRANGIVADGVVDGNSVRFGPDSGWFRTREEARNALRAWRSGK